MPSADATITYGSWLFLRKPMFCAIASAVPLYQKPLSNVIDGVNTYKPPCFLPKSHHFEELKCSFKERALYCVKTATF